MSRALAAFLLGLTACSFDPSGLPGDGEDVPSSTDADGGAMTSAESADASGAPRPETADATPSEPVIADASPPPPPPPPLPPSPSPLPALCDPASSSGCPAGSACRLSTMPGSTIVYVGCEPAGNLGHGYACSLPSQCAPGLGCFTSAFGGGICLQYCHADVAGSCAGLSSTGCGAFNPPVWLNGHSIGVCSWAG